MKRTRKMRRHTRHHITAKTNGGSSHRSNLINLWWQKHQSWHAIFGNRSLEEIIDVLLRLKRFKDRQGRLTHGDTVPMTDTLQECIDNGYKLIDYNSGGTRVR